MTTLLVPIALDVLVVREQAEDDGSAQPSARPPGAYLHWALPDALTAGRPGRTTLEFPAVPNRWLIFRLSGSSADASQRAVDGWLLPDSGATTAVKLLHVLENPPLPADSGGASTPLTAVGSGDLAWAAYFDNVENRFALYDDLAGVVGPVAYTICGWYVDARHDPISATTEAEFVDRMTDLRWHLAQSEGSAYPTRSAYHAAALSIGWPFANWAGDGGVLGKELDLRPDPSHIEAALGETLVEAIAALSPRALDHGTARLMEGTLASLLSEAASETELVALDASLHMSRFGAVPARGEDTFEMVWEAEARDTDELGAGSIRQANRSRPRMFHALDPNVVIRGGGRSSKHGGDGRYTSTGELLCRTDSDTLTAFGVEGGDPARGADVLPPAALAPLSAAYGIPDGLASRLLVELACLDPGSAPRPPAGETGPSDVAAARARFWEMFGPSTPMPPEIPGAVIEGVLPSPIAVTPPTRPWSPLHLTWAAAYLPSRQLARDWSLGEVDYEMLADFERSDVDLEHPLAGSILLSASPGELLTQATGDAALADEDLISAPLADLGAQLRSAGSEAEPVRPVALRAGCLQIQRLQLVDGFGQHVDLRVPLHMGSSLVVDGEPELAALRPRLTAPARLLARFVDADMGAAEAAAGVSPICGFIVVRLRDGTLEFFDAEGGGYGRLRADSVSGAAWEDNPGRSSTLGARPSELLPNPHLGKLADSILFRDMAAAESGRNGSIRTTLDSVVRVLDTARWATDSVGDAGDEQLSLLLGQPIAVVRAVISLDLEDPEHSLVQALHPLPIKLGTLAQLQDGLLAYVVGDDFDRLHTIDPDISAFASDGVALAPFVDPSGYFQLDPSRKIFLTLLMLPGADVFVSSGLLPQKRLGLLREWTSAALSKLSPALRIGPILRDASATRLPVPPDVHGEWTWHHRPAPWQWTSNEVVPATAAALLPDEPVLASDGWLRVRLLPDTDRTQESVRMDLICMKGADGVIEAVGGKNDDGSHFLLPVGQAIEMIESGRFSMFVGDFAVEVQQSLSGVKTLTRVAELPVCTHERRVWLHATVDNSGDVYINEKLVGVIRDWGTGVHLDVTHAIRPGQRNVLAIRGFNYSSMWGLDRGIIAHLTMDGILGEKPFLLTDREWRVAQTVSDDWYTMQYDDSGWQRAVVLGKHGIGPWGAVLRESKAEWIWYYQVPTDGTRKPDQEYVYARREFYVPLDDDLLDVMGFYTGEWGEMLLAKRGDQIVGVYMHDQGTIVGRFADGKMVGWWTESPSRTAPSDAGDVEFRWKRTPDGRVFIDGRWRYGTSGEWREDWDLALGPDARVPPELLARLNRSIQLPTARRP